MLGTCGSGLVSRKGRKAPPAIPTAQHSVQVLPATDRLPHPLGLVQRQLVEFAQAVLAVRVANPARCHHELRVYQALGRFVTVIAQPGQVGQGMDCLLYTSDAADEL